MMICKECWIYRQRLEHTKEQLSSLPMECAHLFRKELKDPVKAQRITESLNQTLDILESQWRCLIVEISDRECPEGECLLRSELCHTKAEKNIS